MASKINNRQVPQRYINDLLASKCGPDMLALKLFPNAKEITESYGCYYGIGQHLQELGLEFGDPKVNLISIGDGGTPRTSALFAFKSRWNCYGVDPEFNMDKWRGSKVDRLSVHKNRIQDCKFEFDDPCVLIFCHAHVRIDESLKSIKSPRIVVLAIPCCVPLYIAGKPHDIEYRDPYIGSPHNLIKIWKNL